METFLVRTKPASNIAKQAAIHMTRKPPIKKSSVLKTKASFAAKLSSVGASCANAIAGAHTAIAAAPPKIFANLRMVVPFQIYFVGASCGVMAIGASPFASWMKLGAATRIFCAASCAICPMDVHG